jgi:hypothetical protein
MNVSEELDAHWTTRRRYLECDKLAYQLYENLDLVYKQEPPIFFQFRSVILI